MSAIPEDFIKKTAQLSEDVTRPFPGSTKIYVTGSRPDIRVPMRQIRQSETAASFGVEKNPPITVYDTSGPYSDPAADIDLLAGLPDVRKAWIEERFDTEQLDGPGSDYGRERQSNPELAHLRFEHIRKPCHANALCAPGHYHARDGVCGDPGKPAARGNAGQWFVKTASGQQFRGKYSGKGHG